MELADLSVERQVRLHRSLGLFLRAAVAATLMVTDVFKPLNTLNTTNEHWTVTIGYYDNKR